MEKQLKSKELRAGNIVKEIKTSQVCVIYSVGIGAIDMDRERYAYSGVPIDVDWGTKIKFRHPDIRFESADNGGLNILIKGEEFTTVKFYHELQNLVYGLFRRELEFRHILESDANCYRNTSRKEDC